MNKETLREKLEPFLDMEKLTKHYGLTDEPLDAEIDMFIGDLPND